MNWRTGLYPYQLDAISAIANEFNMGCWSQLCVIPTGGGKTHVFSRIKAALQPWFDRFEPHQQKILVLAHRDELLVQAANKLQDANPDLIIGIEQGDRETTWMHDVVIASVPTLAARNGARLRQLYPQDFRIVIVDEAHHAPADTYQQVLQYFDLVPPKELITKDLAASRARLRGWWAASNPERLLLGVTATPARGDAVGLEWTFRSLVYEKTLRELIDAGYLSPLRGLLLETDTDLDRLKWTAGDFNVGQLAAAVNTPELNAAIARQYAVEMAPRPTIAFCVDIQHARDMADAFLNAGVPAVWVSGEDGSGGSRRAAIDAYERGDARVICNCQVLTEGYDYPATAGIIMARPTASQALYMQCIGRGTRKAPEKTECVILDVVGVSKRHSLVSVGDLFGLPHGFNLEGEDPIAMADRVGELLKLCPNAPDVTSIAQLESVVRTIDLWMIREPEEARTMTRLRWMRGVGHKYFVPCPEYRENGTVDSGQGAEQIEVHEDVLSGWSIVRLINGVIVESLGRVDELRAAFVRAERWIEHHRSGAFRMQLKAAPWRSKPATPKQIAALKRLGVAFDVSQLSRGDASALMDLRLQRQA